MSLSNFNETIAETNVYVLMILVSLITIAILKIKNKEIKNVFSIVYRFKK